MSLINDMLKDLEARGSVPAGGVRPAPAPRVEKTSMRRLVVLLTLLAGGLAAALAYLAWQDRAAPLSEPLNAAIPEPVAAMHDADIDAEKTEALAAVAEPPARETRVEPSGGERAEPAESSPANVDAASEDTNVAPVVAEPAPAARQPVETPPVTAEEDEGVVMVRRHEPTPQQRAQRAARDGMTALRRGDWAVAARLLQELVALEPANDDAREGLAVAMQRQGRLAEADGVLLDGMALAAQPARFAKLRARMQAARGDFDAALASLSMAVPPVADDPGYHALKGALAQQAGRHAEAREIYAALAAFKPDNGTWQAGLAMALDGSGETERAREAYQRALDAGGLEPALLAHVERRFAALNNE